MLYIISIVIAVVVWGNLQTVWFVKGSCRSLITNTIVFHIGQPSNHEDGRLPIPMVTLSKHSP